ncbi:hypothetical protein K432DRAFT_381397, partial [Lepidopterella palustris CBS 459.81]
MSLPGSAIWLPSLLAENLTALATFPTAATNKGATGHTPVASITKGKAATSNLASSPLVACSKFQNHSQLANQCDSHSSRRKLCIYNCGFSWYKYDRVTVCPRVVPCRCSIDLGAALKIY